ncbi:hypothetical protein GCM10010437_090730 [Actinoplanes palleronii]
MPSTDPSRPFDAEHGPQPPLRCRARTPAALPASITHSHPAKHHTAAEPPGPQRPPPTCTEHIRHHSGAVPLALVTPGTPLPFTATVDAKDLLTRIELQVPAAEGQKAGVWRTSVFGYGTTTAPELTIKQLIIK